MRSAVICHAAGDKSFAENLARFLEINCPIEVSLAEGEIRDGEDLIDRIEWAASADIALALLSPASACKEWKRQKWESAFAEQSMLALLLLRNCSFPNLWRGLHFFDASQDSLACQRALKQWLLGICGRFNDGGQLPGNSEGYSPAPEFLEDLRRHVSDRPGMQFDVPRNAALAFATEFRDDFEGIVWIDCAYRDQTGILGDAASLLRLTSAAPVEENQKNLLHTCSEHRYLLVFENMLPEFRDSFRLQGRSSAIFTTPEELKAPRPLAELASLFSNWTSDHTGCLRALGEAKHHLELLPFLDARNASIAMRLGSAMCALLKHHDRLAEAYELLDLMKEAAQTEGDTLRRYDFEWEQSWILERWGVSTFRPEPPSIPTPEAVQTGFDFGAGGV